MQDFQDQQNDVQMQYTIIASKLYFYLGSL